LTSKEGFIPNTGDIVWLEFDPQSGHEQAGHRPALVLTSSKYNLAAGLMLCCPLTTKIKNYPFEVLTTIDGIENAVLADQVKSLDWVARNAKYKSRITETQMLEVKAKLKALLEI
jgi:mRNA interferase MazF